MRRLGVLLAGTVAALAAVAAGPASAAGSGPAGFVGASPAPGSSADATGSYFVLRAEAGAVVHQTLLLTNHGGGPVTAEVRGVDAGSAVGRGAVYGLPSDTAAGVGTWIVPDTASVTVGPGKQVRASFAVRVPTGAGAGQYLGGVSVSARAPSANAQGASAANVAVDVTMESQRVLGVEVEVPGPLAPRLEVTSAAVVGTPGARHLVVGVTNAGNALVRASGTLHVPALGISRDVVVRTFVPGTRVDIDVPWPAADGSRYAAVLGLDYGGARLDWSGTVGTPGAPRTAARTSRSTRRGGSPVPWVIGLAAAALLVGVGMALAARRRTAPGPRADRRRATRAVTQARRARRRA